MRQHWDHAGREIHRRATLACVLVEGAVGTDVVTDIRDRDNQPETIFVRFSINRIVKVACGLTIDRYQWDRTKILASIRLAGINLISPGLRLTKCRRRKFMWQVEPGDS